MLRRKRSFNRTVKIALGRLVKSPMWPFLRVPLLLIGIPLILVFTAFVLVPVALIIAGVSNLVDRYRRYCPVHHVRFCYEYVHLSSKEANRNRQRRLEDEEFARQAEAKGLRQGHSSSRQCDEFPYPGTEPLSYEEAGAYRIRYCPKCRDAEGKAKASERRRERVYLAWKKQLRLDAQTFIQEQRLQEDVASDT
jgi:hypothetical protein